MLQLCRSPALCLAAIAAVMIAGMGGGWQWPGLVGFQSETVLRDWYYSSWLIAIALPALGLSLALRRMRYVDMTGVWWLLAMAAMAFDGPRGFRVAEIIGQLWLLWLWWAAWRTANEKNEISIATIALALHLWRFVQGLIIKALDTGWTPEMPDSDVRVLGWPGAYMVAIIVLAALLAISWLAERERRT